MSIWYALCNALSIEMLQWDFMKNALLALRLPCSASSLP